MCKISFAVLCLYLVGAFAREEDVLELGDSDFDSVLAQHETALVMFYAPWCGHCKRLKPEYAIAAEDLLRNDPPVALVKVDCTAAGKETCNKNSVSGYPTLKIFRKGVLSQDYNGPREAAGIVKFMKGQVGPSSKELSSVADLEKFLKRDNDVAVVGFFEKESDLKAAFLQLADKLRETTRFAHSSFKDVLEKQGEKDAVILFRPALLKNKFEDNSVKYTGKADSTELDDFIKKNYHGLAGLRQRDNARDFHDPLVIVYYDVDYKRNAKGTNYWRNRVLKVAKEYQDRASFAISNSDDLEKELQDFGLEYNKGDKPKVAARDVKGQKFVMEVEFSVEALDKFVQDMLSGKLEPHLKSEPIPESQDEPVKVAVAKNFDELVIENGKDTLIEFYAPWCGHCKKLTPIYTEVAEKLKDEEVAIVKMDATANDVPSAFEVRGFPTLFWLPKDAKDKPVSYEGGRDTDDFIKYIAKHATNELKGFDREGNPKEAGKTEL